MMDCQQQQQQQQQEVQLARPSSANATLSVMHPDVPRSVQMCPSLYRAAYEGQTDKVMALLQQRLGSECYQATGIIQHGRCDILEESAERNTVLHVAAEHGRHELIRELFLKLREQEGLLDRQNSALETPLHCAAKEGHFSAVEVLIELAGRDCGKRILGYKNEAGDTALHLAARHGHDKAVKVLVLAAVEPATELNNAKVSPLYLAVVSGSVPAVRAITTTCRGASSVGPNSQNALHAAVFQSSEMVRLLLEWRPALVDQVDSSGSSPLHFASSDGDRAMVHTILHAAPPTTMYKKDNKDGLSALHVAARMGHHRVVADMLESCPDAAELRDSGGGTFLHAAAREKRSSVVSLAVKNPMLRGFLNAQDRKGNTPLHLAVDAGSSGDVVTLLRKGKVRPDVLNNDGRTALDLALETNSFSTMVKVVMSLVASGAQLQPKRQDHLKKWSAVDPTEEIPKTSDSLAVVAVLIATSAFAAGFNVPGGYDEKKGKANLVDEFAFKAFLVMDAVAAATSVVAVILLVYGKASRSAGSWKSFAWALLFMWVSLVSLMLTFYAALLAVASSRELGFVYMAIYACMCGLQIWIVSRIQPPRITWGNFFPRNMKKAIKRQYPLASASLLNLYLFIVIGFLMSIAFAIIHYKCPNNLQASAVAPSPC